MPIQLILKQPAHAHHPRRLWYNWPEALMFYAFKGLGKHKDHFKVDIDV